jgi:hypothetical protein
MRAFGRVDHFTQCPERNAARRLPPTKGQRIVNTTTMSRAECWRLIVAEAVDGPVSADSQGGKLTAAILGRAALAQRVQDTHERALCESRRLLDDVQRLVTALERDGMSASRAGNTFAGRARSVSGTLIRLEAARGAFEAVEGYRRAEETIAAAALPSAHTEIEEVEQEQQEEDEEEGTED